VPAGVEAVVVMVSVEVALEPEVRLTLVGLTATVRPVAVGDTAADSETVPVNPILPTVMVEVAELPARTVAEVGLAVTVKSDVTVNVTVAV
jgi:hypothetical protein